MRKTGSSLKLLNLGSIHEGWLESVRGLLEEIMDPEVLREAIPTVPVDALHDRLRSLRSVCLVDDLSLLRSRQVFPERLGTDGFGNEDLYGLLRTLRDAPLVYEDDPPTTLRPEDLLPAGEFSELFAGSLREAQAAAGHEPHHGEVTEDLAPDVRGAGTGVLVDCYGLYVENLHGWAAGLGPSWGNAGIEETFREHPEYREADGPAVLLSPELISTIHRLVMGRATYPVRHYLSPDTSPDRIFLKLVLLHEIGHHVYPVHRGRASKNVSEAFANWFAYGFLEPGERAVMHEMSETQEEPYRMYEGLLALLHPTGPATPGTAAAPWNVHSGGDFMNFLEMAAFDAVLGDPAGLEGSQWSALAPWVAGDAELWSAVPGAPQLQPWLRSIAPGIGLHPAKGLAWTLLSEAVPGPGGILANAMAGLQFAGSGPWRPMSLMQQYAWLYAAWGSPRGRL